MFNHQRNHHINRQPIVEEDAKNTRVAEVDSSCCRCPPVTRTKPYRSADRAELVTMLCRHIKRSRTLPLAESGIFHQFPGFIRAPPATTLLPLRPSDCSGQHTLLSVSNIGISRYWAVLHCFPSALLHSTTIRLYQLDLSDFILLTCLCDYQSQQWTNFIVYFREVILDKKTHLTDKWTCINKFMQEMYHVSKSIIY